jgi:uncharacterized protein (TIGR00661 family)
MRILYAVQGTGNGHITCAQDIVPLLQKHGEVDLLVSGCQVEVALPHPLKYRYGGLSFVFGRKGGIDYVQTYKRSNLQRLFLEIVSLPVEEYDLVISDFEPVSAWACYLKNKPCIGLSHQNAVVNKHAPRSAKKDVLGRAVLKYYAPVSTRYGFHFLSYDQNIFTPLIRREIRRLAVSNQGHYTVYLPAYSDARILRMLHLFPEVRWEVFSKHCTEVYQQEHISVQPVDGPRFLQSMAAAEGVLCGAGFQTPSEVLFLKKKLLVIPMKGQYEQQCNAVALKMMGVPVLKNLKRKHTEKIKEWLAQPATLQLEAPDQTEAIIDTIIRKHYKDVPLPFRKKIIDSPSKFREHVLKKIFA